MTSAAILRAIQAAERQVQIQPEYAPEIEAMIARMGDLLANAPIDIQEKLVYDNHAT